MITFKEYFMLQEAPTVMQNPFQARQNDQEMRNPPAVPASGGKIPPGPERIGNALRTNKDMTDPTYPQGAPVGRTTPTPPVDQAPQATQPGAVDSELSRIEAIPNDVDRKAAFMNYYNDVHGQLMSKKVSNDDIDAAASDWSNTTGDGTPVGVPDTTGYQNLLKQRSGIVKKGTELGLFDSAVIELKDGNLMLSD